MKAMIQFRRYVPLAAEQGARVILKVLKAVRADESAKFW
jgi:hypothetical protein